MITLILEQRLVLLLNLLRVIRSIKITNGGSGYSQSAPPAVVVSEPFGPEGILAELSANVSAAGTVALLILLLVVETSYLPVMEIISRIFQSHFLVVVGQQQKQSLTQFYSLLIGRLNLLLILDYPPLPSMNSYLIL